MCVYMLSNEIELRCAYACVMSGDVWWYVGGFLVVWLVGFVVISLLCGPQFVRFRN